MQSIGIVLNENLFSISLMITGFKTHKHPSLYLKNFYVEVTDRNS